MKSKDVTAGMTEEQALVIGAKQGFVVRAVERDGEHLIITAGYRPDRRNIVLKNGVVTEVTRG